MKKLFLILTVFLSTSFVAFSTHIVGGEFQLVEQRAGLYDIFLNLYFDDINGNPQAEDQSFTASIYSKANHQLMSTVYMERIQKVQVDYENPECTIMQVETSKITYAAKNTDDAQMVFNLH